MEFLIYCNNNTYVLKVTEQIKNTRRQSAKDVMSHIFSIVYYCGAA
jgi:hypothetical protein